MIGLSVKPFRFSNLRFAQSYGVDMSLFIIIVQGFGVPSYFTLIFVTRVTSDAWRDFSLLKSVFRFAIASVLLNLGFELTVTPTVDTHVPDTVKWTQNEETFL